MIHEVKLVKAFTKNPTEGNPAGVLLDATGLSDEERIRIAAELGFSESAFVEASDKADFLVRFFTATQEVNLCGHATIATFHALLEEGMISLDDAECVTKVQESKAGLLPVTIYPDGLIVMTQPSPEFGQIIVNRIEVAELLGLRESDLVEGLPLEVVSTGTPKLMIPVKSLDALFKMQPKLSRISQYGKDHGIKGLYPFTSGLIDPESDFHARQFNPPDINEDPITGVAAGALGAYAVKHRLLPKTKFIVEQGYVMNKPGKMYVEIGDQVKVGGYAVTFGRAMI